MLLVPWAEESLGAKAASAIAGTEIETCVPRTYAIVTPGRRRDERMMLQLESLAGPILACVAKPRSPVMALFVDVKSESQALGSASPLESKRAIYWHNDARNRQIAAIADAAAAGDQDALCRQLGVDVELERISGYRPPRVAVVVEAVEHARQLAALLPDWTICAATKEHDANEGAHQDRRIVSAVYAAEHRVKAELLIRASGGEGLVRAKGFPPAAEYGYTPPPVLLIDFADQFAKPAAASARRRARVYRRAGMQVYSSPTLQGDTRVHPGPPDQARPRIGSSSLTRQQLGLATASPADRC
jgi:hypothetical protein